MENIINNSLDNLNKENENLLNKDSYDIYLINQELKKNNDLLKKELSKYKESESSIRINEEKNLFIVNNIKEVIFQTDSLGNLTFLNSSWFYITGFSVESSLERSLFDYVILEDRDSIIKFFNLTITGESDYLNSQFQFKTSNNEIKWCEIYLKPDYNNSSRIVGTTGTINDITLQIQSQQRLREAKEKAEQVANLKSEFLATMSHEIRTPMNGVIGMTSLLLQTNLTKDQKDFVETIRISGDSLLTIINDILDFSKIESGKMDLENHPFELNQCIEEAYKLFTVKALEKDLELAYYIENNVPFNIEGDSTRLRQVLVNLIGNSVKFTQKGEIFTSIKLIDKENDNVKLEFCIRDTGIGISKDKISKLFTPFYQTDSSTTRKFGGTGLGLAICQKLVNLMGGNIRFESELGKGSSCYFSINVLANTSPSNTYINMTLPEMKNKSILIVNENKVVAEALELQFKKWGLKASVAVEDNSCIEEIKQNKNLDIVIIDFENYNTILNIANKIRQIRTKKSLPLILLTDKNNNYFEDEKIKEIFSSIIFKPIKQSELLGTVFDTLSKTSNKISLENKSPSFSLGNLYEKFPLKILIAEDNPTNQKLLKFMLESIGYSPDIVGNGLEVIEALNRQSYNFIFMDVQMPEMDGLEATKQIIREFKNRPVIVAITANAMAGDREICFKAGMDDYLTKPIKIDVIKYVIEKWGKYLYLGIDSNAKKDIFVDKKANFANTEVNYNKAFDPSVLGYMALSIGQDEKKFIISNLDGFDDFLQKKTIELRNALDNKDFKKVSFISHTLKGSCLNLGVLEVAEIGNIIDGRIKQNDFNGLDDLYQELISSINRFKISYKEFVLL
ncbi:MAG: response regulator [Candidatus Sericytochromatia bacterium]|nr:response regulator [Candidatus Sericytochromatia bacterium]